MDTNDIRWNEQARGKMLEDADRVLREAVLDIAASGPGDDSDAIYANLNSRLKDRFIDYEPGPDVRRFADGIAAGEFAAAQAHDGLRSDPQRITEPVTEPGGETEPTG
ncbi:MAG: hypothetical protein H7146_09045 [Burkholderiaceae bacterium]|nr:hypothetical protein [Microbacteriaceae bacterium]